MSYRVYKEINNYSKCSKCSKPNNKCNSYKATKTYNPKVNNFNNNTSNYSNKCTVNNTGKKCSNSFICKHNSLNTKKTNNNYPFKTCNCSKYVKSTNYNYNCYNNYPSNTYNYNYPVNNCNRRPRYGLWFLLFFAFLL